MQRLARTLIKKSSTLKKSNLAYQNIKQFSQVQSNQYAEQMFESWLQDPSTVHPYWNYYFQNNQGNSTSGLKMNKKVLDKVKNQTNLFMKAYVILQRYKIRGHELADLDPLQLKKNYGNWQQFGFNNYKDILEGVPLTEKELDTPFFVEQGEYLKEVSYFLQQKEVWTLREIISLSEKIYTGKFGVEFYHIESQEQRHWIQQRIEELALNQISKEQQIKTLNSLIKNDVFNNFLKDRFLTKRFGIEGCDSFISGLESMVEFAVQKGIKNIILGMPHRGRLNTLYQVMGKPLEEIMTEFQDKKMQITQNHNIWGGAGDVKYHLGVSLDRQYGEKKVNMRILANPSHLEAVNPVVMGTTKAIQDFTQDSQGDQSMGIIIHGDSAISGQGIVYESFQMSPLQGYTSHGVFHVIVNNQIGFTTTPAEYRSGAHPSEVAKSVESPVFHVNADEPELVNQIMQIAFEFRQKFKKDVVVDIVGYRRFGHNELDQPKFTQPIMYEVINNKIKPIVQIYSDRLIEQGVVNQEYVQEQTKKEMTLMETAYITSRGDTFNIREWQAKQWETTREPTRFGSVKDTAVPVKTLQLIGNKLTTIPEEFNIHPLIKKVFDLRNQSIQTGKRIDMATAESLAWGSLLFEGFGVRLSGQDVERGTFSHRHAILVDQKKDSKYSPFHTLLSEEQKSKNQFTVINSHLSEYGVLGFEYGYSITNPNMLCMWEAQFGDFANGAQIMIDNYISTGETKWGVQAGLVLLLPHGFDGQGAEHSSARLERFLQLTDDDYTKINPNRTERVKRQVRNCNWQIVNCSTSVNYFHALRRQIRRDFRKPLICMTSKKQLRLKEASSDLQEFEDQRRFQVCYPDQNPTLPPEQIKRVVLCSGQVYWDIQEFRKTNSREDIAIIRVEQLAPFPYDFVKDVLKQYTNAQFVWCQEEHKNQGAWTYVSPRINLLLSELHLQGKFSQNLEVSYIGRKTSASTAVGSMNIHKKELEIFLTNLLNF